jgi:hypothetical protein
VHQLFSLAFVPVEDVDVLQSSEVLLDVLPDKLADLAEYFEKYYVRWRPAQGRRQGVAPRYPSEWWKQYEAVIHTQPRTNNLL